MAAVLRAVFGYLLLVFMLRIVGRRPGQQMTPFEFVLIFFSGGLALTFMVADDESLTNALSQITAVVLTHYAIAWLKARSNVVGRVVDGTPLILLEHGRWRTETMKNQRIVLADVMAALRSEGLQRLDQVEYAVLERNGEISIIQADER